MKPLTLKQLKIDIKKLASPKKAKILQRFFKTQKGEYGEGDIFLGLMVPKQRALVKKYWRCLNLADIDKLLKSKIHEERLIALLVLVKKFDDFNRHPELVSGSKNGFQNKFGMTQKDIFDFYLAHTKYINNWDLVDLSAPKIVGSYLYSLSLEGEGRVRGKNDILIKLAKSKNLWERRIAMLATFQFICFKQSKDALAIAKILLYDKHDLIHKAVGWMLREAGKRCSEKKLTDFLNQYSGKMPRVMLRYAIERLPREKRKYYLNK